MRFALAIVLIFLATSASATYLRQTDQVTVQTSDGNTVLQISVRGKVEFCLTQPGIATFTWDANEDDVDGYYLYCSGPTEIKTQTDTTSATVDLTTGKWVCWVTAYKGEMESGPSNKISVEIK